MLEIYVWIENFILNKN